jgi:hypothetical protein
MSEARPYCISKNEVWEAYQRVKENKGAAGIDEQSIEDFEKNLKRIFTRSGIACHRVAIFHHRFGR